MNIGIVSTRIRGLDGVSLETAKWTTVLQRMGHSVFYCAGELDLDDVEGWSVDEMHFLDEDNQYLHKRAFGTGTDRLDRLDIHHRIELAAAHLRGHLEAFLRHYKIDLLITENAQAIPVHLPLGVALYDLIRHGDILAIGHHHDFYWERRRFKRNRVEDMLHDFFPPHLPNEKHVVINTLMREVLKDRCDIDATCIPNVFDFATPAPRIDEFNADFRQAIGLKDGDVLILQPTRLVRRKAIERSVELVRRLNLADEGRPEGRYKLVLTGGSGDEGKDYERRLRQIIFETRIPALFIRDYLAPERFHGDGEKRYALWDAYVHADFVTYPSEYEGFGNALIETLYFRKPLLVNRYSVYRADIEPLGIDAVTIDGKIQDETVEQVKHVLEDAGRRRRMVETNFQVGLRDFSYERLETQLRALLDGIRSG